MRTGTKVHPRLGSWVDRETAAWLRYARWLGVLPYRREAASQRIRLSPPHLACAAISAATIMSCAMYGIILKGNWQTAPQLILMTQYLLAATGTAAIVVTSTTRIASIDKSLRLLEQIKTSGGKFITIKDHFLVALSIVTYFVMWISVGIQWYYQPELYYNGVLLLVVLSMCAMDGLALAHEALFCVAVNSLRACLVAPHHDPGYGDHLSAPDSKEILSTLRAGCRAQRLVRQRAQQLCASFGFPLLLSIASVTVDFIIYIAIFLSQFPAFGNFLGVKINVEHIVMNTCKTLLCADPCDKLCFSCQHNLEDLKHLLLHSGLKTSDICSYRDVRFSLYMLGNLDSSFSCCGVLPLKRSVLLSVLGLASTYCVIFVQAYDGTI